MELYSKQMGAVESSMHAAQRMTHDPSLQVGVFAPCCSTCSFDEIDTCMN